MEKYENFQIRMTEISDKYDLKDYHAFIAWFGETVLGHSDKFLLNSMCDGTHDKGVDAIFIDTDERKVMVVQSKYELKGNKSQAKENDVKLLATVRKYFSSKSGVDAILHNANSVVSRLIREAYDKIKKEKYELELVFITTHREIPNIHNIVTDTLCFKKGEYSLYFYDEIMLKFSDSLRDYTPDIGTYNLKYCDADKAIIRRKKDTLYNSWVVSVPLDDIRQLVHKYRDKLFKKNVRNFLGKSICNKGIINTLEKEQEHFWYYNNGITILTDEASIIMESGYVRLKNPQIVNGCQTVRSVEKYNGELTGALVVRIVESKNHDFINQLTLYQNTSNPVSERDLKANDPIQVRLKHQFQHKKIYFEIKRGEEFRKMKSKYPSYKLMYDDHINNEDVAKLLATVKINPHVASSKGSKHFFGEAYELIFNEKISTNEILSLVYLRDGIMESYSRKKRFHEFDWHWKFKGRAIFLALNFIYDSLPKIIDFDSKFVKTYDNLPEEEHVKVFKKFYKIMDSYFEMIYRSYKLSEETYHNTFLQAKDTYNIIRKENKTKILPLMNKTKKLFSDLLD